MMRRSACLGWGGPVRLVLGLFVAVVSVLVLVSGVASAGVVVAPGWAVRSVAVPSIFSAGPLASCGEIGACDGYFVTVTNVGTAASSGVVVINDVLPAGTRGGGVQPHSAKAYEPGSTSGEGETITCAADVEGASCSYEGALAPGGVITVHVLVEVTGGATTVAGNHVEVSGGGAGSVFVVGPATSAGGPPAGFGVQQLAVGAFSADGEPVTQAGSHPESLLTSVAYNSVLDLRLPGEEYEQVAEPKLENVDLPMGFIGDALAAPRCSSALLAAGHCPSDTRVGVVGVYSAEVREDEFPLLYNITPEAGYPAQFGFNVYETVVMLRPRVLPSAAGYVLSVPVPAVPRSEAKQLHEVSVMLFGDPDAIDGAGTGETMLTAPGDCAAGPLDATLEMNAWIDPSDWQSASAPMFAASSGEALTGCEALQFSPSIEAKPDETTQVDTPSGYEVNLRVPQAPNVEGDLASADLKDAVVTLPAGVSISPSAANGLAACAASGPEGIQLGDHDQVDADRLAQEGIIQEGEERGYHGNEDGLVHAAAGHCPAASQVGEVEVISPLVEAPLKGHVYIAAPSCGGEGQPGCSTASATNGELYGLYLEVAGSGIVIKLHGVVSADPATGQLTTTFQENPQFPFSELKLKLDGGQRAPLANPETCGTFQTTSDLTPWSTPFTPDATPSSSFSTGGCASSTPFAPAFSAGMSSTLKAGAFSPFTFTLTRQDPEQDFSQISTTLPPGLVGVLASVPLCEEPQAAAGTCPESSKIGTTTVAAGAGSDPFWVTGSVYLTGPYNGAPFGLSIVVPAKAGPFNLGNEIVRSAITINTTTSAVTVTSAPLPQIKDGIPFRLKTINVTINRPGFTLNPTNCEPKTIAGTIAAAQGATAAVSSAFAAEGCKSLAFSPKVTISTAGNATKKDGASLYFKIAYPKGALGTDAWFREAKFVIPKQLPARLTTIQKACLQKTFEQNPANCPKESRIGYAEVHTPILPVPLKGPVFFVSYGNAKFPDVVVVLQGDGVTVDLTGETLIKNGITSATFPSTPDVPFESLQVILPTGEYSEFGSYVTKKHPYQLCGTKLLVPTELKAQNGTDIKSNTPIQVTGCHKTTKKTKTKPRKSNAKTSKQPHHA